MITHGQACFIVAAGMMFATYVANRVSPVRSLLWSFLAEAILALESLAWFVLIVLSMIASAMTIRYLLPGRSAADESESEDRAFAIFHSAAYDMPGLGKSLFEARSSSQTAPSEGLRHTLVATFVGLLAIAGLSAGLWTRRGVAESRAF